MIRSSYWHLINCWLFYRSFLPCFLPYCLTLWFYDFFVAVWLNLLLKFVYRPHSSFVAYIKYLIASYFKHVTTAIAYRNFILLLLLPSSHFRSLMLQLTSFYIMYTVTNYFSYFSLICLFLNFLTRVISDLCTIITILENLALNMYTYLYLLVNFTHSCFYDINYIFLFEFEKCPLVFLVRQS